MTQELTIYRHEAKSRAQWAFILMAAQLTVAANYMGVAATQAAEAMGRFALAARKMRKTVR
jgi:hypothetical protein